ncbi:gliding motility-associated C-terminal domain-containing protein [Maribacter sp. MJ134]|uniref:gliding motility-associated C-terminal domain-containing protein n=1 Tax=Maribacter sp. MJ134 TaxID=2496865 RepID=UPI000F846431|nr:gliding motility-associated C-terminal domain-containing protein [Maribacter sp. MJ134]AZQ59173.1 gliding motility-associated C-terminal domain-containing protein [Maribacter sp. MJ134]
MKFNYLHLLFFVVLFWSIPVSSQFILDAPNTRDESNYRWYEASDLSTVLGTDSFYEVTQPGVYFATYDGTLCGSNATGYFIVTDCNDPENQVILDITENINEVTTINWNDPSLSGSEPTVTATQTVERYVATITRADNPTVLPSFTVVCIASLNSNIDSDNDGIVNLFEDLDLDGDNDPATNPTDKDNDGIPDYLDIDSDNDGIPDNVEAQNVADYVAPSGIDANNNGLDDAYENNGNLGLVPIDTDGDGIPDYVDDDSDNDTVPDNIEGHDFNQDGVADVSFSGNDTDGDGLNDGFEGNEVNDNDVNDDIDDPQSSLPDTDGDGIPDFRDLDDDGDGINTPDEDIDNNGDPTNDDSDNDGRPDYLDPNGPVFTDPNFEDITIICGDPIPPITDLGDVGGCTPPLVEFSEEIQMVDGSDDYNIERIWMVSDSCGNTANFTQTIFVLQQQLAEIQIEICIEDSPVDLLDYLPESFDPSDTFTLFQEGTQLNGSTFDPTVHGIGDYTISYTSSVDTCRYEVDFIVTVDQDCADCGIVSLEVSKAVTANNDGVNDLFEIRNNELCDYTFNVMIFNRWGNKVFESQNYQNDWGGSSPDNAVFKSDSLPTGTYYYIVSINEQPNFEPLNGFIYLSVD